MTLELLRKVLKTRNTEFQSQKVFKKEKTTNRFQGGIQSSLNFYEDVVETKLTISTKYFPHEQSGVV